MTPLTPWSSPEVVARFATSPPNEELIRFATVEQRRGTGLRLLDILQRRVAHQRVAGQDVEVNVGQRLDVLSVPDHIGTNTAFYRISRVSTLNFSQNRCISL